VRELLDDVLHDEGYEVVAVHDGAIALQVIESLKVDLITLDLDLPGLTGSELLNLLQKRKIQIPPVVVVTGKIPVKRQVKQMAQAVIMKPFDIDELVQVVLDLLPRDMTKARARLKRRGVGEED
jgi:DNA-binding response OmpR family regulator